MQCVAKDGRRAAGGAAAGHVTPPMPMRVLQVTYSYKPVKGGADVYAEDLAQVIRARGHEAWVIQKPPRPEDDPYVLCYPRTFMLLQPFWLLPTSLPLMVRQLSRFDVLVCHYPNYCLPALWHPRVIGLSHGVTWDDRPAALRSRVKRAWAQWAFRHCAKYVANDTFFLRQMGLQIAPGQGLFSEVAPGRWYVPNAVDTRIFCPGPPSAEAEKLQPFLLVPRNIYWNRGVHLAIEAFARLGQQAEGHRLAVVGSEGQSEAVAAAWEAVARNCLGDRVIFVGPRPREELVGWYRAAEVTVIPSLCGEGTSLAALESMACGTPVVSTDAGGLTDLPCVHVPTDAESLAAAMSEVLARRGEEAQRQMEAVRRDFTLERWAAAWTAVLEEW
ncbi:MAG: glycosyltransferase family 4 protein [Armatimonadetes bacterium]|nr:glycosyltransferase family 4 protein [Armatimonadota bacterium]